MTSITQDTLQNEPKYPRGVFVMFFLQLLTMVGFSMIFSLIVLYCTRSLGMPDVKAYQMSAAYNALVFALSVPGGYLGERYLGYRFAVLVSFILAVIGLLILMINSVYAFYWGLSIFTVASGVMVPCTFVLLGRLYHVHDPRRDSGFTIAYIGMNVGSVIASASSGFIANYLGYSFAYLNGALCSALAILVFLYYRKVFKRPEAATDFSRERPNAIRRSRRTGMIYLLISLPVVTLLFNFSNFCNLLLIALGGFCVFLVIYLAFKETRRYRVKLLIFLFLNIVSVSFWALYMLSPSALMIFIANNVNRDVFGWVIPTATFSGLNPFFIIVLGPLLSILWMSLNQRGKRVSTMTKFSIGLLLMGLGYLVLMVAIRFHSNVLGIISAGWIVLSYFFQTVGELFVGPIGYAMVGELVPSRLEGLMMGVWQLSTGVAAAFSGYIAIMTTIPGHGHSPIITNPLFSHIFSLFGWITLVVGLITLMLSPLFNRIIHRAEVDFKNNQH